MDYASPHSVWSALHARRQPIIDRFERYAALTIPSMLLEEGTNLEDTDQTHDYQSMGAQAVNHITNKMMLAMFAPSRPIMRLELDEKSVMQAQQMGLKQEDIEDALAQEEQKSRRQLDSLGQRAKLYTVIRNLVVFGNVLLVLDDKEKLIRAMGPQEYVVKRTQTGKVHTLVIKECVRFDELADDVQDMFAYKYTPDSEVEHYLMIKRMGKGFKLCQSVGSDLLPEEFNSQWANAEDCPYHALTWNLADKADYGTGLVEEYSGDLETLSVLSEAIVDGAVLSAQFRYMVDPTSQTDADTLNKSRNGDAVPGRADDISVLQAQTAQAVKIAAEISEQWGQRVARGFLMASAVTRSAERVTAEEIRATANELETALGGVYSHLAVALQMPVARWLLRTSDIKIKKETLKISIVTGLDALSRNGDLEALRGALNDAALVAQLAPAMQGRLKMDAVFSAVGQGWGVSTRKFLKSDDEMQADQQTAIQSNAQAAGAEAGAVAQAEQGM